MLCGVPYWISCRINLSFLFKLTALSDWDWARYCASELTRNSPLTSFIGKHLTDLWLYTLEFQESLSTPEVRETWERKSFASPAIFLRLPCWDYVSLPFIGMRSSSTWFWNCSSHSFIRSCWLGEKKYFLGKCEKFLFCRLSGRRADTISFKTLL